MLRSISIYILLLVVFVAFEAADAALVLYLPMDEGQGDTTADLSGSGNNGTLEDDPVWVQGKYGNALEFDAGSRVHIPASNSMHGDIYKDDFTFLAWINPARSGDTWQHIIRSVDGADATQCSLFLNTNGFLSWRGRVAEVWGEHCGTPDDTIPANEWTHIALVSDQINYKIYANAAEVGSAPYEEMDGGITDFYLAFDGREWAEAYTGIIDEVYMLTEAKSVAEIAEIMEGSVAPVQPVDKLTATWGHIKGD
jgi:hypothetical protein